MSADFQGIQGDGTSAAYEGQYTWAGDTKARILVDLRVHQKGLHGGPNGMSLHDAARQGYYQARDDYDGQWLWVRAGEMVPMTAELLLAKDAEPIASRAELRALLAALTGTVAAIEGLLK